MRQWRVLFVYHRPASPPFSLAALATTLFHPVNRCLETFKTFKNQCNIYTTNNKQLNFRRLTIKVLPHTASYCKAGYTVCTEKLTKFRKQLRLLG